MASSHEKLASALKELRGLQADGARVFASEQLTRTSRERLLEAGFVQEVIKGWLVSADPAARHGDTTYWFSSFWEFCQRYCDDRFGDDWFLSPDESLLVHAEKSTVPNQLLINSPRANNKPIQLVHGISLFALKRDLPATTDLVVRNGLRVYAIDAALVRVTENFFRDHPIEAQLVLQAVSEPSGLLSRLLADGHTVIAGRLVGSFRRIGRKDVADEIVAAMKSAGHSVRESDPFESNERIPEASPLRPTPFVGRLQTLWTATRDAVLREFSSVVPRADAKKNLSMIDEVYELDAYHSLSIEGYVVSEQLIERVASGAWDPEKVASDREHMNALAARGYWLAFEAVRSAITGLVNGDEIAVLRSAHRAWYRKLFEPQVSTGLFDASLLAGYRNGPVFLRGSRHIPPRAEVARDAMPALFDLIEHETLPAVRAVLAHWLLGYVHPFPDGNGRVARFLMNALLVHGGYPWTIIRVEDRNEYLGTLEAASADTDIRPFAAFVAKQVQQSARLSGTSTGSRPKRTSRTRKDKR